MNRLPLRWVVAGFLLAGLVLVSSVAMATARPVYWHDDEHSATCWIFGGRAMSCYPDIHVP